MRILDYLKKSFIEPYKSILIILLITAGIIIIYGQIISHGFLVFDDEMYVLKNLVVKKGITVEGLTWAFGFHDKTYWHPVTWLSHMLDVEIFGLNSGMHHFMNLFFHILNSLLLYIFFKTATGSCWKSGFVAALFALHPVNVDSVAWVAERKNLLSTFFWFLTMLMYIYYIKSPRVSKYILVLCIFVLGLLSKPMLVTVPFVLFLMDYWPLKRFQFVLREQSQKKEKYAGTRFSYQGPAISRLIAEKVPMIIFSIGAIVISDLALRYNGTHIDTSHVPMGFRLENAIVSYLIYMGKMIWPANLTFYYPYPDSIPFWKFIGAGMLLVLISLIAVRFIFRAPYFIVGWLWFLGTLVPVSGIMQGGLWPEIAERWAYVPYIGLFIIISWGIPELVHGVRYAKEVLPAFTLVVIMILTTISWRQAGFWKNDYTLCSHGLEVDPQNNVAHVNIGLYLANHGQNREAIKHYEQALKIYPADINALNNIGRAYKELGEKDKALYYLSEVVRYNLNNNLNIDAHFGRGLIYAEKGDMDKAVNEFTSVISLNPKHALAYYNLGILLAKKGQKDKAVEYFSKALIINPNDVTVHNSLGVVLMNQGKTDEALRHFRLALKINPKSNEARSNLAAALKYDKKISEDIMLLENEKSKAPNDPGILHKLAMLYASKGDYAKALEVMSRLVDIQPNNPDGYYNLACIYSRGGNIDKSTTWLKKSIEKGFKDWVLLMRDKDLDNIRGTQFYKDLINKTHG